MASSRKRLTGMMTDCLQTTSRSGGRLVRFPGGYWAPEGSSLREPGGAPLFYYTGQTILALIERECFEVTKRLPQGDPMEVRINPKGVAAYAH